MSPRLMQSRLHRPRRQRGFSLLEMLVALLLVSTSALGLAMLVVNALAAGTAAQLQDSATMLLGDAGELAAVGLLDATTIGRWQGAAASALPAPVDPLSEATVQTDLTDASRKRRIIALRWTEPGSGGDRLAALTALAADWRP